MIVHNSLRHIRSFVRREGRMTGSQKQAIDSFWHQYGVEFNKAKLDLDHLFQRSSPKILDIGTGMGDSTIKLARQHPENDYLAVEVHRPGIGSLLKQIAEYQLQNIRISNHDVIDVIKYQVPANSLDQVFIFFPDPWPKKRHHKRRLINQTFLDVLSARMKSHARLYIATDWQDYTDHILYVMEMRNDFINLAGTGFSPRPKWRPVTKFEKRGKDLEHGVRDLVFARK